MADQPEKNNPKEAPARPELEKIKGFLPLFDYIKKIFHLNNNEKIENKVELDKNIKSKKSKPRI